MGSIDLSLYMAGATDVEHVRSITTCEQIMINELDTKRAGKLGGTSLLYNMSYMLLQSVANQIATRIKD
jgi:hypothetical protein